MELFAQGAEARIYRTKFLTKDTIVKERFSKKYRHPLLDQKITSRRCVQEARNIVKVRRAGIDTPCLYFVDVDNSRIFMEFIHGLSLKQYIVQHQQQQQQQQQQTQSLEWEQKIIEMVGQTLANLHDVNIIHGDLTTSNLLIRDPPFSLVVIDFGLSYTSTLPEDKAVDLYVLERAFLSTHPNTEELFSLILEQYAKSSKNSPAVLKRLHQVRQRGRKKLAFG